MQRMQLSSQELADWLTAELRSAVLASAYVTEVKPLPSPDDNGCNWSPDVAVETGNADPIRVRRAARRIAADARRWFNLS
jgi:hypothetical protein